MDNSSICDDSFNIDESESQYDYDFETNDLVVIQTVERFPIIYDKSNMDYKNLLKKENAWLAISGALGKTVDEAQRNWERLRRRFTKTRRELKEPPKSGSSATNQRVWPLFKSMQFLEACVPSRRTCGNVKSKVLARPSTSLPGSSSPWDPFAPGMPLEVIPACQSVNDHASSTSSSQSSSLSSNLNLHSSSQPIRTPSTLFHRSMQPLSSLPASSASPASSSHSLPTSRMSSPDAFHTDKRQKLDSFESFIRAKMDQNTASMERIVSNQPGSSRPNANKDFSNYLCQLFDSVQPLERRLLCQQQVIGVISSFISGNEK